MERDHYLKTIWIHTLLVIMTGLTALYSATYHNFKAGADVFFDQLFCAGVGVLIMYGLSKVHYRKYYDVAYILYLMSTLVLVFVLLAGRHAMGARRWMEIGGFSFQPSEPMKLAFIFFLARYFANRRPKLSFDFRSSLHIFFRDIFIPLLFTGIVMLLIFKQPDLGTSLLFLGIFIVLLYASGIDFRYFGGFIFILVAAVPFLWHFLKGYQKQRLMVFLNPNEDPLGAGYTIIQSKIAIGSGQLFGKGWLSGTQNQLSFLPERHTDFIFSVIGEEFGFLGSVFLVYCFFRIIYCGFKIAESTKDQFGMFLALGITTLLSLQVIINMGMVMGLLPVVGITLPLISYGRTSFIVSVIMIGILMNLSKNRTVF